MVVRGAPAIGVSAAYGIALGAKHTKAKTSRRICPRVRPHLRPPRRHPPHRRQSLLGHRPHEGPLRQSARLRRNPRPGPGKAPRRSPRHVRGRHRRLQNHGRIRRRLAAPRRRRAHPLQRRSPRHLRLRNRSRRHPLRRRAGQAASTSSPTKPAPSCRARASPPGN